jgi:SAM-dependent methyltransferase
MTFLDPMPPMERLAAFYPEGYWTGPGSGGARARLTELYRRFVLRDHLRFVHRVLRQRREEGRRLDLIDVGCGDGSFLELCEAPVKCGMDVSRGAARAARARGLDVVVGMLDHCPFPDGAFAVVTTYHMLEHVCPAEPTLQAARRLLEDGGDLVVQVPNAASWQAALLGGRWAGLDAPRHLMNYTPKTLRAALERNGFEVLRESQFSIRDNPTAFANSIAPGLYPPARAARGEPRKGLGPVLGDLAYLGLTLAAMPFTFVESAFGHGGTVMVQARKR